MIRTRSVTPKAAAAPPMPPKLDETSETGRVQIVAPLSWLAKIEEWRRAQPKIPSLSGAIRQLVDIGLASEEARRGKKG